MKIVREERRITKDELAVRLNVSKGTVFNIMKSNRIRKLCSRCVPYFLSREMCDQRMQCCQQNLTLYEEVGDSLLKNLITEDETPLSLYLPEDRRSSQEYKFPGETATRKLRSGTIHRRGLMLVIFWDCQGVVLRDFVDRDTKLNANYCATKIREVRKCRRKPRGQCLSSTRQCANTYRQHQQGSSSVNRVYETTTSSLQPGSCAE